MARRHMMMYSEPDNGHFVECSEDELIARRLSLTERSRLIASARQQSLALQLSEQAYAEYAADHLHHMLDNEVTTIPDVSCIDTQTEIQWYMRPFLLDFMVETHGAFQLQPETLFLAVNLLDRYCSKRIVYKRHYQLIGCASLLVAAKYGDRKERVPTIRELKGMCCFLYDECMFMQMEEHLLDTLNWRLAHPTMEAFLQIAVAESGSDCEVEDMARYISEMAMYSRDFVSTLPSTMARSSLALAKCILGRAQSRLTDWSSAYDPYIMVGLSQQLSRPSQVLSRKYASSRFSSVAVTVESFVARQASIAQGYAPHSPPGERHWQKADGGSGVPQTPQKGGIPSIPTGVLTPPVTPDAIDSLLNNAAQACNIPPRLDPATPTSMHSHSGPPALVVSGPDPMDF